MAAKDSKLPWYSLVKDGFLRGIGFSFGSSLGFALLSGLIVFILKQAGGLPIIGTFFASIVESTQSALMR